MYYIPSMFNMIFNSNENKTPTTTTHTEQKKNDEEV